MRSSRFGRADGATAARAVTVVALAALTLLIYAQVRNHPFIGLDDTRDIAGNASVRAGLTADGARWAFSIGHPPYWHPLTTLSHMADVEFFGLDAGAHLLVNVALHFLNAALFFGLVGLASGSWWAATLAATLFVAHPLRVESVAWAAARKDVLSGFFWMLTLLFSVSAVRRPSRGRRAVAAALFVLGLLAKPVLVVLPLVLLALDFWPLDRFRAERFPRLLLERLPLALIAAPVALITVLVVRNTTFAERSFPLSERLANAAVAAVAYLGQTVWPSGLAIFYPHPAGAGAGTPLWQFAGAAAVLTGITVAVWRLRVGRPWLLAGWVWYVAALAPTLGIVQNWEQSRADRFTYLPLAGLFWALAQEAARAARRFPRARRAVVLGGAVAVAALTLAARGQVAWWSSPEKLFGRALAVTEDNWLASSQLGVVRLRQGRDAEAERLLRRALELRPLQPVARNNLAILLDRTGRGEEAAREYETAIAQDPGYAEALVNLGTLRFRAGGTAEALELYRRAVAARPDLAVAHANLGLALEASGRVAEAVARYETALRLDPLERVAAGALRRLRGR